METIRELPSRMTARVLAKNGESLMANQHGHEAREITGRIAATD